MLSQIRRQQRWNLVMLKISTSHLKQSNQVKILVLGKLGKKALKDIAIPLAR